MVADNTKDLRDSMTDFVAYVAASEAYQMVEVEMGNGLIVARYQDVLCCEDT